MVLLQDRVALITGASRGLGAAAATALAGAGCKVAVNFLSQQEKAERVVAAIREQGGVAETFQADVRDPNQVHQLRASVEAQLGSVDVLVNNAGNIPRPGDWQSLGGEALLQTIESNLTSVIHVNREFLPGMAERGWGRVINVSSTYAYVGAGAVLAYTAAKAGIMPITFALARELGPKGVTVNAVAPGNFATDMAEEAGEGFKEWVESTAPLGRLGDPEEFADAVLFLAKASYITGHVLVVDGGHILNM